MKKFIMMFIGVAVATAMAGVSVSSAGTITWDDTTVNWQGFEGVAMQVDENGTPKIDSMTVTWDDTTRALESVSINLKSPGAQKYDSLFISTDGSWDSWDFLVHSGGNAHDSKTEGNVAGDGLWIVNNPFDYTLVGDYAGIRAGHANGIDADSLTFMSELTSSYDGVNLISYDFTGSGIVLGDTFSFGYTPWCANDVIVGTAPVPEPATMLLFGVGLVGLVGASKKRANKTP
jgi:hypothetical protein